MVLPERFEGISRSTAYSFATLSGGLLTTCCPWPKAPRGLLPPEASMAMTVIRMMRVTCRVLVVFIAVLRDRATLQRLYWHFEKEGIRRLFGLYRPLRRTLFAFDLDFHG